MTTRLGIDIFSGAGGLSLGARCAGISIEYAIEKDVDAARTYKHNHSCTEVINTDIHLVNPSDWNLNNVFVVFGGPPCQGYSTSNTRTRNVSNPSNSLFEEFIRFVSVLKPKWFVFENVEGILNFNGGVTIKKIIKCFEDLGYDVQFKILDASDYGVPQCRHRFFMVGNNYGAEFVFPQPITEKVSVREAIYDLPLLVNGDQFDSLPYRVNWDDCSAYVKSLRGRNLSCSLQNYVSRNKDYVIERYKYIGQGQNWSAVPDNLMSNYSNKNNCHSGIYKRLKEDIPSVVISNYRKNMLIHPTQDRGLSVREAARLQSFPDSYIFLGCLMNIQQQIGNAVPPLLSQRVFEQIIVADTMKMRKSQL